MLRYDVSINLRESSWGSYRSKCHGLVLVKQVGGVAIGCACKTHLSVYVGVRNRHGHQPRVFGGSKGLCLQNVTVLVHRDGLYRQFIIKVAEVAKASKVQRSRDSLMSTNCCLICPNRFEPVSDPLPTQVSGTVTS